MAHKVEIEIDTHGVVSTIKGEMTFSNGKAQAFEYTTLPPSATVDCMDEWAHLLKNIDLFNRRIDGKINKLEITKIIT